MDSVNIENKSPVIVYNGWGNVTVFPCSIEIARDMLVDAVKEFKELSGRDFIEAELLEKIAADKKDCIDPNVPRVISMARINKAFNDLDKLDVDSLSSHLYILSEVNPEKHGKVKILQSWKDEFAVWSFRNKVSLGNRDGISISDELLNKTQPQNTLTFLSGLKARSIGRPILFVDADTMERVEEFNQLLFGTWKENANVSAVVGRYLMALNEMCHRDEKYQMGSFEMKA